jgi:diacylglycerol kinase
MSEQRITVDLSRADAEVLLGVLAAERHNAAVEAVCDALRQQLDDKLAASG